MPRLPQITAIRKASRARGTVTVLRSLRLAAVSADGDEITSVLARGSEGEEAELSGDYFLDAHRPRGPRRDVRRRACPRGSRTAPRVSPPWIVPDSLRKRIEPLLQKVKRRNLHARRKRLDDRRVLCGILFVQHTGIGWESPPQERAFGPGMTC